MARYLFQKVIVLFFLAFWRKIFEFSTHQPSLLKNNSPSKLVPPLPPPSLRDLPKSGWYQRYIFLKRSNFGFPPDNISKCNFFARCAQALLGHNTAPHPFVQAWSSSFMQQGPKRQPSALNRYYSWACWHHEHHLATRFTRSPFIYQMHSPALAGPTSVSIQKKCRKGHIDLTKHSGIWQGFVSCLSEHNTFIATTNGRFHTYSTRNAEYFQNLWASARLGLSI